jgi:hypothetical protein
MLGADVIVPQPQRFFAAQADNILHTIGKIAFHS